ncbi:hypothetical protein [Bradyrhizobium japonicum]|uniref:Uncharacterized protein n=1 Tax=Bradyrhizobium japonicum TaxID=375 RepID=A0ABV2RLA0_BRAJP|nr:hypothetical protein [Bradyrhizobium japonicum]MCP1762434.1 hypothetical protein [Bradyrhizobium japonicum]MCP1794014.1 hypothetical protein [Bradyrhizobium japonicum]MCP1806448.1 hypothetical protein [Bradyrhizobium japonicum]MCP1815375.1 hypothetical protein [Bradyrhizobium japonicum]MCP1873108.1 hypothetical protein [Bradyrhizobium japonicum]
MRQANSRSQDAREPHHDGDDAQQSDNAGITQAVYSRARASGWGCAMQDRLFTALIVLSGIGSTVLAAIVVFSL